MPRCECETTAHFSDDATSALPQFHEYGADVATVTAVRTGYGTFHVCDECRIYHYYMKREVSENVR